MIDFKEVFPADICEVQGIPYIFTNARVNRNTIPKDIFAYDVRDDEDGEFWQIQSFVAVNHWGTIVGFRELKLDEDNTYWCLPSDEEQCYSSEGAFIDFVEDSAEFKRRFANYQECSLKTIGEELEKDKAKNGKGGR